MTFVKVYCSQYYHDRIRKKCVAYIDVHRDDFKEVANQLVFIFGIDNNLFPIPVHHPTIGSIFGTAFKGGIYMPYLVYYYHTSQFCGNTSL